MHAYTLKYVVCVCVIFFKVSKFSAFIYWRRGNAWLEELTVTEFLLEVLPVTANSTFNFITFK